MNIAHCVGVGPNNLHSQNTTETVKSMNIIHTNGASHPNTDGTKSNVASPLINKCACEAHQGRWQASLFDQENFRYVIYHVTVHCCHFLLVLNNIQNFLALFLHIAAGFSLFCVSQPAFVFNALAIEDVGNE